MKIDWNQVYTIAAALLSGGGLATILAYVANRRKNNAVGRSVEIKGELQIVDSAVALVTTMREDIQRLSARLEQLELRNQRLDARIEGLENENQTLEERVRDLTQTNSSLSEKVAHLTAQNRDLAERCNALEEENRRLRPGG